MGPTTSQPIDRDVLTGFRAGDEGSLERVFKQRFTELTDDARQQFGETHGPAPKVVERAFLRAWEERARFETPEALESFLRESVHEQVVRERSRIAALHRIDGHDSLRGGLPRAAAQRAIEPIPLEESWKHVHAMLHPASAEVRHKALDDARHEAAHHLADITKPRSLKLPLITAGVIAAAILGGLWWVDQNSADAAVSNALSSADARVIGSGAGQIGSTTLKDGTTAKVGPDTKLTISPTYGTNLRAVKLEGAASFNVQPGVKEPFAVRVRDVTIYATGTAFDVTAFPADPSVIVRVREGSVDVRGEGDPRTVTAGHAVAVNKEGAVSDISGPALQQAVAWVDGKFAVADRPLREVLPLLTRWYRIDLQVKDSSLLGRPVNGAATLDSSMAAIREIEKSTGLKFDWEGKTMVLRDAKAAAPAAPPAPKKKR
jgi:ferric-dicitrate binding protein FerR (iron transport regulator)